MTPCEENHWITAFGDKKSDGRTRERVISVRADAPTVALLCNYLMIDFVCSNSITASAQSSIDCSAPLRTKSGEAGAS